MTREKKPLSLPTTTKKPSVVIFPCGAGHPLPIIWVRSMTFFTPLSVWFLGGKRAVKCGPNQNPQLRKERDGFPPKTQITTSLLTFNFSSTHYTLVRSSGGGAHRVDGRRHPQKGKEKEHFCTVGSAHKSPQLQILPDGSLTQQKQNLLCAGPHSSFQLLLNI